jgi:hypothetical protein
MAKYIEECDPDGPIIIYIQKVDNKNHNMCGRILSGTYNRQYLRNIYKKKRIFYYKPIGLYKNQHFRWKYDLYATDISLP